MLNYYRYLFYKRKKGKSLTQSEKNEIEKTLESNLESNKKSNDHLQKNEFVSEGNPSNIKELETQKDEIESNLVNGRNLPEFTHSTNNLNSTTISDKKTVQVCSSEIKFEIKRENEISIPKEIKQESLPLHEKKLSDNIEIQNQNNNKRADLSLDRYYSNSDEKINCHKNKVPNSTKSKV